MVLTGSTTNVKMQIMPRCAIIVGERRIKEKLGSSGN